MYCKWILREPLHGEILVFAMELGSIPPTGLTDLAACRRARERARTRIRVEVRHLAFLDHLAARVRRENDGRLSRAELLAILVRVLMAADLEVEKIRSERDLTDLLRERSRLLSARAPEEGGERGERTESEAVTLRLPLDELVRLDLLLAEIRHGAGIFVGRSGVVRALVNWLAEANVGITAIRSGRDLEHRLLGLVSGSTDGSAGVVNPGGRIHRARGGEASL